MSLSLLGGGLLPACLGACAGFWVYWEPGHGMSGPGEAGWSVVHYTSINLQEWRFNQTVRRDSFAVKL